MPPETSPQTISRHLRAARKLLPTPIQFTTPACSSGGLTGTPTSWRTLIAVTVTTVWAVGFLASVAFPTVVRTELAAGASPIVLTAVAGLFAGDRRR